MFFRSVDRANMCDSVSQAPSLMFDVILNVTLSEEVSTTVVTQEILELLLRPNCPDPHQTQI